MTEMLKNHCNKESNELSSCIKKAPINRCFLQIGNLVDCSSHITMKLTL